MSNYEHFDKIDHIVPEMRTWLEDAVVWYAIDGNMKNADLAAAELAELRAAVKEAEVIIKDFLAGADYGGGKRWLQKYGGQK